MVILVEERLDCKLRTEHNTTVREVKKGGIIGFVRKLIDKKGEMRLQGFIYIYKLTLSYFNLIVYFMFQQRQLISERHLKSLSCWFWGGGYQFDYVVVQGR